MSWEIATATIDEVDYLYDNFIEPYFPEAEKKPLSSIKRMMETGLYKVLYLKKNEHIGATAFLTTYEKGQSYLLDYLAVDKNLRSGGLGGILLRECVNQTDGKPIIIETESVEHAKDDRQKDKRDRRNSFYQRNGAVATGIKTCIFGMIYDNWLLFDVKNQSDSETYRDRKNVIGELEKIYKFMVNKPQSYQKNVIIPYEGKNCH